MTCSGRFASAAQYESLICAGIDITDAGQVAYVNGYLDIAAADVHAAMAAVGACDCTLASWATVYLQKLNIIDALVIHNCPCGNRVTDEQRRTWLEWLDRQFELIRTGKIALCAGDTGSEFPAFATIEFSWTVWNEAEIIVNEELKGIP